MEYEIKYKKFDKKRPIDAQVNDLINELKLIGVKLIDNSKLNNGHGEGVCLVLTQLLDKYLINRNFIFKKPKLIEKDNHVQEEIPTEFEEVILEDNLNINYANKDSKNNLVHNAFKGNNELSNFNIKNNLTLKDIVKARFSSGRKRWSSAMSNLTQGN